MDDAAGLVDVGLPFPELRPRDLFICVSAGESDVLGSNAGGAVAA
ncbi:hypothetical protein ACFWYW_17305 [Nonomuraea sp. NPDC059023]